MKDAPSSPQAVTLANLGDGAALEQFQAAFDEVLRNVSDVNTDPEQRRSVQLTVSIVPNEEREIGEVQIKVATKLAGNKPVKTTVFLVRHAGQTIAVEQNPKQLALGMDLPSNIRSIAGGKES
jgi:hypothetical protein